MNFDDTKDFSGLFIQTQILENLQKRITFFFFFRKAKENYLIKGY